jgi:hypothetical protein
MKLDWWTVLGLRVKYNPAITPPFKGEILKPYPFSFGRFKKASCTVALRKFPKAAPARTSDG